MARQATCHPERRYFAKEQCRACYQRTNKGRFPSQTRAASNERLKRCRLLARGAVVAALGGHCATCGFSDARALEIDHVHNDGVNDRYFHQGVYTSWHRKILNEILSGSDRYQLLCANCNRIKERERRETGHLLRNLAVR